MARQGELEWVKNAREYIGLREIKGVRNDPTIIRMLDDMGKFSGEARAWWRDDETPWCGLFVGHVMGQSGRYVVKEWYRAKEWATPLLTKLEKPAYGSIAVLSRHGGGHVGLVVGTNTKGQVMLLGGNQSDMVQISAFDPSRIDGYYWPSRWIDGTPIKSWPAAGRYDLPLLASDGKTVTLS